MKIKKFNLFITSDINSPGKSISFSNIFIYSCIFVLSIVLFFSIIGFYHMFIYDEINSSNSHFSEKSIIEESILDSLYFIQDPVKISSGFDDPVITSSYHNNHKAIDITGPIGTKIYSVMPGKVFYEGNDKKMGNVIVISHENGYITKYMHNKKNFVQTGESISLNWEHQEEADFLRYEILRNDEVILSIDDVSVNQYQDFPDQGNDYTYYIKVVDNAELSVNSNSLSVESSEFYPNDISLSSIRSFFKFLLICWLFILELKFFNFISLDSINYFLIFLK